METAVTGRQGKGGKMLEITSENFDKEVKSSKEPVLVDFWAPWCMPCKMIAPAVDALAGQMKGKLKVCKLNVDESPELATQLSILNIPTLVLFKNGREATRIVGVNSKEAIEEAVNQEIG
jgi:thioredoxin 1